jgi:hypothetical protein
MHGIFCGVGFITPILKVKRYPCCSLFLYFFYFKLHCTKLYWYYYCTNFTKLFMLDYPQQSSIRANILYAPRRETKSALKKNTLSGSGVYPFSHCAVMPPRQLHLCLVATRLHGPGYLLLLGHQLLFLPSRDPTSSSPGTKSGLVLLSGGLLLATAARTPSSAR